MWLINYMLHNLTPNEDKIWITYDIDFLPATMPAAATIRPAHPIWMDVQRGSIYPVFDVLKGSGANGTFTYPDQAVDPYHGRRPKNEWTVPRDGVLVGTGGHLHPGGLHTDLWVRRGASTAHLFRSDAHYWEPAGAVSWDVAMTVTDPTWRATVKKGDVLRITASYDSKRASWYESMGIMVTWWADGTDGPDPFTAKVDRPGHLTHGHLPENDHHGGGRTSLPDATRLANGPATNTVTSAEFEYVPGSTDLRQSPPVVKQGQTITFVNKDAPLDNGIWHTITACKAPCNRGTGIAYPIADANIQFDSGELGTGGPPTANRVTWQTPGDLPPGTYTYFCRIHPSMRGAFRVVPANA